MRRIFLPLVFLAIVVAAWVYTAQRGPLGTEWQGYAEGDYVKVGPTLAGLVTTVHVARGDVVAKDAPLFDQDDVNDKAALDQAARLYGQAQNQLHNLQTPARDTEIQTAEANLLDAQAARDKVRINLARNQDLLKTGAASTQLVEDQKADLRSAEAKVQGLEASLAQMRSSYGREGDIKAQGAAVEAAQAVIAQARWKLDQRHVIAPAAGTIADVMVRPGEMVSAGAPVVSLLPPENVFVRFFVPEPDLAKLHLGDKVGIVCDNCVRDLTAQISFIAPQVEYTPPVIYSEAQNAKYVVLLEARAQKGAALRLNPGQPVTVRPLGSGAQP
ncbi:HlyD family secretion protein [Methylovirgula sp. 4M-Z18]|uniref:HlyD family secretion protein n=1 Tax=Methylovirgula sp. 4M-Z18 TaxID=2293567 RepID=UPI000E2F2104|nr:HlyD family efflux transporter periplasmic adaptor subunit [Methylovirgula sp. 4M-Z18]RFB81406.1 HlyD family efflux transporter periplasmic adaptor subunit [Methylovirgula sp. 4M-Z18]